MAITKEIITDKIEILVVRDWFEIGIREATIIKEDGKEISRTFKRGVIAPDSDISNRPEEIKKITEIYFTDEVKNAHKAYMESQGVLTE